MNVKIMKSNAASAFLKASTQYGHKLKEWNPKMAPYLLDERNGCHIFNITKTSKLLKLAGHILQKKANEGSSFLFVGTDKVSAPLVAQYAKSIGSFYVNYRWLGGMLTNWSTIQKQIAYLKFLESQQKVGNFAILSKKDLAIKNKEIEKLNKIFCGIKDMKKLPDAIIFTNQLKDSLAIHECVTLGIPAIVIVDSDCNPELIPYPIPANNDSSLAINFILQYLTQKIAFVYNIEQGFKKN